jgi:hypothetical protein
LSDISKRGHYIEDTWRRERREYLKLHIVVDSRSKEIIPFRVTKCIIHNNKKLVALIKEISKYHNITKTYAYKAYDNIANFNLLDNLYIEPVISIRRNATAKTRKYRSRNKRVHLILKLVLINTNN